MYSKVNISIKLKLNDGNEMYKISEREISLFDKDNWEKRERPDLMAVEKARESGDQIIGCEEKKAKQCLRVRWNFENLSIQQQTQNDICMEKGLTWSSMV